MRHCILLCLLACLGFAVSSCKKDAPPENPYDAIDYSTNETSDPEPDPNSIAGLHKNIFSVRCANPGCHDGTFEPDFRTVEASYATLVYQPVNKFTLDSVKFYSHRVLPNNTADSWLVERLVTPTTEYMPSNSVRLSNADIDHVKNWIDAGCPDMDGNLPQRPNLQPNIVGYIATDAAFNRLDTARLDGNPANPFLVDAGTSMSVYFVALDTADGSAATDPANYTVKKLLLSTDKNDFSAAVSANATLYIGSAQAWMVPVNVSAWPSGTTVYFRIAVNDGQHTTDAVFPRNESLDYYKTYFAFHVR